MSLTETISSAIGRVGTAVSAVFKYLREKLKLNNTPDMQANAAAQTDQKIKDAAAAAVKKQDLKTIREQAAK